MFDDPNILTNGIWIERNILQMDFQDQLTTINKYNPAIIFRIIFHWSDIYGYYNTRKLEFKEFIISVCPKEGIRGPEGESGWA